MNSVTTMLLIMQEFDQPQVVISKTVHYAMNRGNNYKSDAREPR